MGATPAYVCAIVKFITTVATVAHFSHFTTMKYSLRCDSDLCLSVVHICQQDLAGRPKEKTALTNL